MKRGRAGPDTSAIARRAGAAGAAAGPLRLGDRPDVGRTAARTTSCSGSRVWRSRRPAAAGPARRGGDHPCRPRPPAPAPAPRPGTRARAAPGRGRGTPRASARSTAGAPPRCRPPPRAAGRRSDVAVTSATGSPTSASSSSRTRVTPARAFLKPAGPHAAHTAGAAVPHRRHTQVVVGLLRPPPRSASQRASSPQAAAREQLGSARPVEHAQHAAARARSREPARSRAGRPGAGPPRGGRPPRRPASRPGHAPGRRCAARPTPSASRVGHGLSEHAGNAGPPGSLDGDVAGVPRRRLLLLVGLVVLVEHDDAAEVGDRRPGRRARPDDGGAGRAPRPVVRDATPPPRRRGAAGGDRGGLRGGRAEHESVAECGAARATCTRFVAGGSRSTEPGRRTLAARTWSARLRRRGPGRGRGRCATTRSGDAVLRRDARRPAHRHAAHPARSTSSGGGPSPLRLASGRSARPPAARRRPRPSTHRPVGRAARCGRRPRRAPGPGACPGPGSRRSCRWPARPGTPGRRARPEPTGYRPSACFRSPTRVACSQVKSLSSRPKCP